MLVAKLLQLLNLHASHLSTQHRTEANSKTQSQPPATTAYPLARCQAVADTCEIVEIKFDLHHKLHNK